MNVYRITVRDRHGKLSDHETKAAKIHLAVQSQDDQSEVVKVERIHPSPGKCLVDFTTSRSPTGVMPLYRLTFKHKDGKTSEFELEAPNLPTGLQCQADISHLIKIERISRITGEVMGGIYDE
jgi:hypothetical protein